MPMHLKLMHLNNSHHSESCDCLNTHSMTGLWVPIILILLFLVVIDKKERERVGDTFQANGAQQAIAGGSWSSAGCQ